MHYVSMEAVINPARTRDAYPNQKDNEQELLQSIIKTKKDPWREYKIEETILWTIVKWDISILPIISVKVWEKGPKYLFFYQKWRYARYRGDEVKESNTNSDQKNSSGELSLYCEQKFFYIQVLPVRIFWIDYGWININLIYH